MYAPNLFGYYRHHKFLQFKAIIRLNTCAVPDHRRCVSIQLSAVKAISRQRQLLDTHRHNLYNRSSILHLCSTPLPAVWLRFRYPTTCRCQTRLYMSRPKALSPLPERGENAIKRLPRDKCKIEFFHSRHDFRDYNERSRGYEDSKEDMDDSYHNGIFTVPFHSKAIVKVAIEYYNNNSEVVQQQLEYYAKHSKRWKKFPFDYIDNDKDIQYYKGKGSRPIPLRVKSEYEGSDDEKGTSETREKVIAIGEEKPKVLEILSIIKTLSQRLVGFEFHRTDEDKYKMSSKFVKMGEPISISDWMKQQMTIDEELSGVILRQPGALEHITTCLAEFDELWNPEKDPFIDDEEDEMEQYRKPVKADVRIKGNKKKKAKKANEKKKKKTLRPEIFESDLPFKLY